jgi:hypothetical protein
MSGARLVGVPDLPAGARAGARKAVEPTHLSEAGLEVLDGHEWRPLETMLEKLRAQSTARELRRTDSDTASAVGDVGVHALTEQLTEAERELADHLTTASVVEQNLSLSEAQAVALDRRIDALEEERTRNQDVKTLLRLGSDHSTAHLADQDCPTCHQSLVAVEAASLGPVLDVDGTLGLLNAQLATARAMREQAAASVVQARNAYAALQRAADSARTRVRSLQADLIAPADYPSTSDIAQRITAETRLSELNRAVSAVQELVERLQELASDIAAARTELIGLPSGLPEEDQQRLFNLTRLVREQLNEFGFSSYESGQIILDDETLRPERAGFDIDTDVSSTDVVRTKIAYLNGIRELAGQARSSHPGLLILDEPRQHELDEQNFRSTLSRLGRSRTQRDQIIVTSSASSAALQGLLGDSTANVIDLGDQRLLQPEPSEDPLDLRRE